METVTSSIATISPAQIALAALAANKPAAFDADRVAPESCYLHTLRYKETSKKEGDKVTKVPAREAWQIIVPALELPLTDNANVADWVADLIYTEQQEAIRKLIDVDKLPDLTDHAVLTLVGLVNYINATSGKLTAKQFKEWLLNDANGVAIIEAFSVRRKKAPTPADIALVVKLLTGVFEGNAPQLVMLQTIKATYLHVLQPSRERDRLAAKLDEQITNALEVQDPDAI